MTKTTEAKPKDAKNHDSKATEPKEKETQAAPTPATSALDATCAKYEADAKELLPTQDDLDSLDPDAVQNRANAVVVELRDAAVKDDTPLLQLISKHSNVTWIALLTALTARARAKANEPGARTVAADVDADKRISAAVSAGEDVRRLVTQVVEAPRRRRKQVEEMRLALFGKRKPGGGRASWMTDVDSIISAIEQLGGGAPEALQLLLPKLRSVSAQLANAEAQAAGRPARDKPIFSTAALEAALALDLALDDLVAWAPGTALPSRNGKLLGAAQGRRRSDAKPAAGTAPGQGDGKTTGDGKTAGDAKAAGADSGKAGADGATPPANGAVTAEKPAAAAAT